MSFKNLDHLVTLIIYPKLYLVFNGKHDLWYLFPLDKKHKEQSLTFDNLLQKVFS